MILLYRVKSLAVFFKLILVIFCCFTPYFFVKKHFVKKYDSNYTAIKSKDFSFVLGDSRLNSGVNPQQITNGLNLGSGLSNLALNNYTSPYGKEYFYFIKKKSNEKENGFFIVGISPWNICNMKEEGLKFREETQLIHNLFLPYPMNGFEYICRYSPSNKSLIRQIVEWKYLNNLRLDLLHENGWKETKTVFKRRTYSDPVTYFGVANKNYERMKYFQKLLDYLSSIGTVVLVRMPISKEVLEIEDKYYQWFEPYLQNLSIENSIPYLNYSMDGHLYEFFDEPGHHLVGKSAIQFSERLAIDLEKYRNSE